MDMLLDGEFWTRLWTIVIIDLTLAGDNALVIALAVRGLPRHQQLWGRIWGTAGAVALRLALVAAATPLLRIPLLQLAGGLLLIWVAFRLVRGAPAHDGHVAGGTSLWAAIRVILVADAAMSLDNMLGVAAAAHGDLRLVVFGVALSLPLVVWGSGLLSRIMARFTWIIWLGGGILGYVAGDMIVSDAAARAWLGDVALSLEVLVPIALAVAMATLGWWSAARAGRVAASR